MRVLSLTAVAVGLAATVAQAAVPASAATSVSVKTSTTTISKSTVTPTKTSPSSSKKTTGTSTTSKKTTTSTKKTTTSTKKTTTSTKKTTTSTKKTSSTKMASKTSSSTTPSPTQCTGEQAANGMTNAGFGDGLKNWKTSTNSTEANAIGVISDPTAPDQDGKAAYFNFPKGKVVTSTISQTILACAHYAEGFYFSWKLADGVGCHLTSSIPPNYNWTSVDLIKDANGTWNGYESSAYQDFGDSQEEGTIFYTPYSVTITCNGSAKSQVRLDDFGFGGIG